MQLMPETIKKSFFLDIGLKFSYIDKVFPDNLNNQSQQDVSMNVNRTLRKVNLDNQHVPLGQRMQQLTNSRHFAFTHSAIWIGSEEKMNYKLFNQSFFHVICNCYKTP